MKYVTIADFGDYTVEEPLETHKYKARQRDEKRLSIKRKREEKVSAIVACIFSSAFIVGMTVLYIFMG